jgi:hypothetical protein
MNNKENIGINTLINRGEDNIEFLDVYGTGNKSIYRDEINYLEEFVGKNYYKIKNRPFNFSAYFFSTTYIFYRKMYTFGTIFILINGICNLFFKTIIISLVLNLILGFTFNSIYISYASNKVRKIENNNESISREEIARICENKGGRSILGIFIGSLIEIGIYIFLLLYITSFSLLPYIKEIIYKLVMYVCK